MVDNIVAAALAYAEKTHGDTDGGAAALFAGGRGGSGTTGASSRSASRTPGKAMSMPVNRSSSAGKKRGGKSDMAGAESPSIHSFYTENDAKKAGGANKMGGGAGMMAYPPAPVEDLVAKALSHAQGQLGGRHPRNMSQPTQETTNPTHFYQPRSNSTHVAQGSGGGGAARNQWSEHSGKSVGSMYSEDDTEYSAQGMGMHYDC